MIIVYLKLRLVIYINEKISLFIPSKDDGL